MTLVFFRANLAWGFMFGDQVIRLHDADVLLFDRRNDAVAAAAKLGLAVAKSGAVSVATDTNEVVA